MKLELMQSRADPPLDVIIEIALGNLTSLYGVLGSDEFSPRKWTYRRGSNTWKVDLVRRIDGLVLNYVMIIDNDTAEVIGFERKFR